MSILNTKQESNLKNFSKDFLKYSNPDPSLFLEKSKKIIHSFSSLPSNEAKYMLLMDMGKKLLTYPKEHKRKENLVTGCQSVLYVHTFFEHQLCFFRAASDALISAGLAALLVSIYQGESPWIILSYPPTFLQDTGIYASLSPNRSNGLAQIYLKMKQDVLAHLSV